MGENLEGKERQRPSVEERIEAQKDRRRVKRQVEEEGRVRVFIYL